MAATAVRTKCSSSPARTGQKTSAGNGWRLLLQAPNPQTRTATCVETRQYPAVPLSANSGRSRCVRLYPESWILATIALAYDGVDVPEVARGGRSDTHRSLPWLEQM